MTDYSITRLDQTVIVRDDTQESLVSLFGDTFDCFDFVDAFQSGLTNSSLAENRPNIVVSSCDGGWLIEDSTEELKQTVTTPGDLAYFLSDRIIVNLVTNMTQGHCVHAACVAKGNKVIVMPAQSGAGKSSLCCWLVANGFDYVTDELVIFAEDGSVSAISRPIQIKPHGVDVVKSLMQLKDNQRIDKQDIVGDVASSYSPNLFGSQKSSLKEFELALILFPQFNKDAKYSLFKTSSAKAAMSLMASHINARSFEAHGFTYMTALARKTDALSLVYGAYSQLNSELLQDLEEFI